MRELCKAFDEEEDASSSKKLEFEFGPLEVWREILSPSASTWKGKKEPGISKMLNSRNEPIKREDSPGLSQSVTDETSGLPILSASTSSKKSKDCKSKDPTIRTAYQVKSIQTKGRPDFEKGQQIG